MAAKEKPYEFQKTVYTTDNGEHYPKAIITAVHGGQQWRVDVVYIDENGELNGVENATYNAGDGSTQGNPPGGGTP